MINHFNIIYSHLKKSEITLLDKNSVEAERKNPNDDFCALIHFKDTRQDKRPYNRKNKLDQNLKEMIFSLLITIEHPKRNQDDKNPNVNLDVFPADKPTKDYSKFLSYIRENQKRLIDLVLETIEFKNWWQASHESLKSGWGR